MKLGLVAIATFCVGALAGCERTDANSQSGVADQTPEIVSVNRINFVGKSKAVIQSDHKITQGEREAFLEFSKRTDDGFGAFYTKDFWSDWGYNTRMITFSDAKKTAQTYCEYSPARRCLLYATLEPVGKWDEYTLPQAVQKLVQGGIQRTGKGNFMAIATNTSGRLGLSFNNKNARDAVAGAMEQCEIDSRGFMKAKPRISAAYQKNGYFDCSVFGIFRK